MKNVHRNDIALWKCVATATRHYADIFGLRLKNVQPLPRRDWNLVFGYCYEDGVILLGVRHRGKPDEAHVVLDTLAHELAHLAHMNHDRYWLSLQGRIVARMSDDGLLDRLLELCEFRR